MSQLYVVQGLDHMEFVHVTYPCGTSFPIESDSIFIHFDLI